MPPRYVQPMQAKVFSRHPRSLNAVLELLHAEREALLSFLNSRHVALQANLEKCIAESSVCNGGNVRDDGLHCDEDGVMEVDKNRLELDRITKSGEPKSRDDGWSSSAGTSKKNWLVNDCTNTSESECAKSDAGKGEETMCSADLGQKSSSDDGYTNSDHWWSAGHGIEHVPTCAFRAKMKQVSKTLHFEGIFCCLIFVNACTMGFEIQYDGTNTGYRLGYDGYDTPAEELWPKTKEIIAVLEIMFGSIFIWEVAFKFVAQGYLFLKSWWNIFDTFIAVFWVVGFVSGLSFRDSPSALKLARLTRLARFFRLMKSFHVIDVLHFLMSALRGCRAVFFWSSIVLVLIMMVFSILLCNAIEYQITTEDQLSPVDRKEMYAYFGTFARSMLTVFELTLGNWVPVTRFVYEKGPDYVGHCLMLYRGFVGEAVMKVIGAIFIMETFKSAQSDDELMIQQKEREIKKYIQKMHALFREADKSGNGFLCYQEFCDVINDPRLNVWLKTMNIDVQDAEVVFKLLDDGDAKLSASEVVGGFSKLKGPATSLDMVQISRYMTRIDTFLTLIGDHLGVVHPNATLELNHLKSRGFGKLFEEH